MKKDLSDLSKVELITLIQDFQYCLSEAEKGMAQAKAKIEWAENNILKVLTLQEGHAQFKALNLNRSK